jgi:transcriptional regulator with XRE-family HTH domain
MKPEHDFNPDMLIIARKIRMLSQQELAEKLGMKRGRLSKIENGPFHQSLAIQGRPFLPDR